MSADATTQAPPAAADTGSVGAVSGENAAGGGNSLPWWEDLARFESNVNSQHGEDGVIARILEFVPPKYKIAVEIGAGDGHTHSNCRRLAGHLIDPLAINRQTGRYEGPPPKALECWNIVAIDHEPGELPAGKEPVNEQAHWQGSRKGSRIPMPVFHPVLKWQVTWRNVNHIAAIQHLPQDFDLLSIDIEGQDFWVWKSLQRQPRIVVIAFNGYLPPGWSPPASPSSGTTPAPAEIRPPAGLLSNTTPAPPAEELPAAWSVPRNGKFKSDGSDYFGASLGALKWLGNKKGYALLHQSESSTLFFVLKSLLPSDFVEPAIEYTPLTGRPAYTGSGKWVPIPEPAAIEETKS